MDKKFIYCLICLLAIAAPLFAQDVEVGEEEAPPEQVIKLEELIIELEPLKVFTIPRMEAELPPIDFVGIFRTERIKPDYRIFILKPSHLDPAKIEDFSVLLAKERF